MDQASESSESDLAKDMSPELQQKLRASLDIAQHYSSTAALSELIEPGQEIVQSGPVLEYGSGEYSLPFIIREI